MRRQVFMPSMSKRSMITPAHLANLVLRAIPSLTSLAARTGSIDNAIDVLYTSSKTELKYFSIPNQ